MEDNKETTKNTIGDFFPNDGPQFPEINLSELVDDKSHDIFIGENGEGLQKGKGLFPFHCVCTAPHDGECKSDCLIDKIIRPVGRPSDFTQEIADKLCHELALGKSMRTVCKPDEMPDMSTVFRWIRTNEEFRNQYARAKEESADALFEETIDIADNSTNDYMDKQYGETTVRVVDQENIQRARLRVDTRKWYMSKLKPKKYGEKMDVTSDGKAIKGNTIVFSDFKADETNG